MKKTIGTLLIIFITCNSFGQMVAVGQYSTKDSSDKVYNAAIEAISEIQFSVKTTDIQEGIIQAERQNTDLNMQVFASVSVIIKQVDGKTLVQATFIRNPGFIGGRKSLKMAQKYGDYIKKVISDLEISIEDKKHKMIY
jgi:hypothetical protein